MDFSENKVSKKWAFAEGMKSGIPIGLGYFAVSFSLGITAFSAGLSVIQSFFASLLCNASAGEYAGFTIIAAGGTYIELVIMTVIANARYTLMSCAMSQRLAPGTNLIHRALISFDLTDELFAVAISKPGYVNPFYYYGAAAVAAPCWAIGTALGAAAGNILPDNFVSALSVALYGMFLAVIIPSAKKDKLIAILIAVCFALSYALNTVEYFSFIPDGVRTIILTVVISSAAAVLFPVKADKERAE